MKRLFIFTSFLFVFTIFKGCSNQGLSYENVNTGEESSNDFEWTTDEKKLKEVYNESDKLAYSISNDFVKGNNSFAFSIFKGLNAEEEDKNVFISPISISTVLAMTLNGAVGDNFIEMKEVLGFKSLSLDEINENYLKLLKSLKRTDKEIPFFMADSIWIGNNRKNEVKKSFQKTLKEYFNSGVFGANSQNEINEWVSNHTNGKITKIIDKFDADSFLLLVNTIYFNASWAYVFEKENTDIDNFYTKKTSKLLNFMKKDVSADSGKEILAFQNNDVVAIKLPFGRKRISFYAFLTKDAGKYKDIDEFIYSSDFENILKWDFYKADIEIKLPRFSIRYEKKLIETLKKIGMQKAFKEFFTKINAEAELKEINHKSYIAVNESGVEAVAETDAEVYVTSDGSSKPQEKEKMKFIAKKPFFFMVKDERNDEILFMGKFANPKEM